MPIKSMLALGVFVLAGWVGQPAFAQNKEGVFAQLDTNHDGRVSRAEAIAAEKRAFDHFDRNGDGRLSWSEFNAGRPGEAPAKPSDGAKKQRQRARKTRFANLDSNGDGQISLAEYLAGTTPYFDRLDRNGDGVIDAQEMQQAFQQTARPQR